MPTGSDPKPGPCPDAGPDPGRDVISNPDPAPDDDASPGPDVDVIPDPSPGPSPSPGTRANAPTNNPRHRTAEATN